METTGAYPIWYTFAIVAFINFVVLALTFTLFKSLQSRANIKTKRWAAGGAIAGFIILTFLELHLIDRFSPDPLTSRPSYGVVKSFFDDLQYQRWGDAWNRLHPNLQNARWRGDVKIFESGYKNTVTIELLSIRLITSGSPASDTYVVYYIDSVSTPIIPGLDRLSEKHLKDIDAVASAVHELRNQVNANGFDVSIFDDKINFYDLVVPNRAIIIGWKLESKEYSSPPLKKCDQLYPERRLVSFNTASKVITQNTDAGWKIFEILPISFKE